MKGTPYFRVNIRVYPRVNAHLRVHHIIYDAFHDDFDPCTSHIIHIDGDSKNNRPENLKQVLK